MVIFSLLSKRNFFYFIKYKIFGKKEKKIPQLIKKKPS